MPMFVYPQLEIKFSDSELSVLLTECVLHEARFTFFHADLFFISEQKIDLQKFCDIFVSISLKMSEKHVQYLHGILLSVSDIGNTLQGMYAYRARFVPTIEPLQHEKESRIFQNQTVVEIAQTILHEQGFRVDAQPLTQSYA